MDTAHPPFNAQATLGALLIGLVISCFLFGLVTLQAYLYYTNFPEDRLRLKAMVALVWFSELGHCICICHTVYYLVIIGYGNPAFLIRTPDSLSLAITFSGIIGPVVQIFFAERVRIVSAGKLIIPIFCWTISTLRLTMSLVATVKALKMTTLAMFQAQWKWLLTTILSIGVAVDVVVAASLCYYLSQQKDSIMKGTTKMIDKIILWTIQTGLLTSITSVAMIICFMTMPDNFVWLAIFAFLARLFSNSLLASLNARTALRRNQFIEATPFNCIGDSTVQNERSQQFDSSQVVIKMTTLTEVGTGTTSGKG